jgi:hypothetical protein
MARKRQRKAKNRMQPQYYPPSKPKHPHEASKPMYLPSSQLRLARLAKKIGVGPDVRGTEQWTEFIKESSADTLESGWILFVELGNGFLCMRQVLGGFPGVFTFAVAFPADKVLELMAVNMTVNDRIDLIFFFALNNYRFRRRWLI